MIQMLTQLRYTMISFRFNMCICTSVYKRPSKNEALAEIFMNDLVNDAKVRVNEVLRKSPQERQYKRWKWNPKSANYLLSHFINFFSVLFFVPINWNFTMKLVLSWLQYEEYSSITDSIILSCYLFWSDKRRFESTIFFINYIRKYLQLKAIFNSEL